MSDARGAARVEAVAWASGIFDVAATLLVLLAVTLARAYDRAPTPAARASLIFVSILALAAKETAVVAGALVLIDAWVRRAIRPALLRDLAVVIGVAGVFGGIRLLGAFGTTAPSFSRYIAQRVVFESYGSYAVPWHERWLTAAPWAAIASALVVITLLVLFFITRGAERPRFAVGAAGVRAHLEPWVAAASERDRILAAANTHGGMRQCGIVSLTGLPDEVEGAYVFRNSTAETFASVGLVVRPVAAPGCSFVWNAATGQFQ